MRQFSKVAVGGTFDELHKGHKTLLNKAFEIGERVLIGLCSDEFAKRLQKPHNTSSYKVRLEELQNYLKKANLSGRAEIIQLNDPFGPTINDKCIKALVVSEETKPTAFRINEKRVEKSLEPIRIFSIKMVPSENCDPISTTRILRGEMDREGHLLKKRGTF